MNRYIQYCISILLITLIAGCKSYSKYTIDDRPLIKIDTSLFGTWKAREDTDTKNFILIQNFYDVAHKYKEMHSDSSDEVKNKDFDYYITYFDRNGRNPHYQQWTVFLSKINSAIFLNSNYRYEETYGYFFIRLIKIVHDTITTSIVADTTLKYLTSSKEVRNRIAKNINNPGFYSDTLHFYKVNNYHLSLNEAVLKAN